LAELRFTELELPGAVARIPGPEDPQQDFGAVQILERNRSRIFAAEIGQKFSYLLRPILNFTPRGKLRP
jgi:hypothetical protein